MTDSKAIFSLIPKVMSEIGAIGKNGVNEYDKYKFRSIDDIYNKLQPVLAKNGIFFVPAVLDSHEEKIKSSTGKDQVRVKLRVKYTIYAQDGSSIESIVEGEAVDRSDKATNKALTAAFKYMAIQVFCIAIEGIDDADKESPELNFVADKEPAPSKPVEKPAKDTGHDPYIQHGKFEGKKVSEIDKGQLADYIVEVSLALKASGKKEPKWFSDLRKVSGL